jgi:hypothetical protein
MLSSRTWTVVLRIGLPICTASAAAAFHTVDQIVVSVGPYTFLYMSVWYLDHCWYCARVLLRPLMFTMWNPRAHFQSRFCKAQSSYAHSLDNSATQILVKCAGNPANQNTTCQKRVQDLEVGACLHAELVSA